MKLVFVFSAILALSAAKPSNEKAYDDLVAMETMELKKTSGDLTPEASAYSYIPPSQRPSQWQNLPTQSWVPPKPDPIQPVHTHVPIPANPSYVPAPVSPPYQPPVSIPSPPSPPVQSDYVPPQNSYYPHYPVPPTTTPTAVIKNEQQFWDNGAYRYEYQLADGTWVGEEGYYTDPKQTEESLVKRGWYSYVANDGKTYTVKYYADHTGYHAFGDHLPASPAETENKQPVTQKPSYPTQPIYYPTNPVYYPQQPGYGK